MAIYAYIVVLCRLIWAYLGLCTTMYGYVGLCSFT